MINIQATDVQRYYQYIGNITFRQIIFLTQNWIITESTRLCYLRYFIVGVLIIFSSGEVAVINITAGTTTSCHKL